MENLSGREKKEQFLLLLGGFFLAVILMVIPIISLINDSNTKETLIKENEKYTAFETEVKDKLVVVDSIMSKVSQINQYKADYLINEEIIQPITSIESVYKEKGNTVDPAYRMFDESSKLFVIYLNDKRELVNEIQQKNTLNDDLQSKATRYGELNTRIHN